MTKLTPTEIRARNSRAHALLLELDAAGGIDWSTLPAEQVDEGRAMIAASRESRSRRGGRWPRAEKSPAQPSA